MLNPPERRAELRLIAHVAARVLGEDEEELLRGALGVVDPDLEARRWVCAAMAQTAVEVAVQTMVQSDPRRTAAATQAIAHFLGWRPPE